MFAKRLHSSEELYAVSEGYHSLLLLWLQHTRVFFKCLAKEMWALLNPTRSLIFDITKKSVFTLPRCLFLPCNVPTHTIISSFQPLLPMLWAVPNRKVHVLTSKLVNKRSNNGLFWYKTQPSRTLTERTQCFLLDSTNLGSIFFQVWGRFSVCWMDYELDYLALKLKHLLFRTHWKQVSNSRSTDLITKRLSDHISCWWLQFLWRELHLHFTIYCNFSSTMQVYV